MNVKTFDKKKSILKKEQKVRNLTSVDATLILCCSPLLNSAKLACKAKTESKFTASELY